MHCRRVHPVGTCAVDLLPVYKDVDIVPFKATDIQIAAAGCPLHPDFGIGVVKHLRQVDLPGLSQPGLVSCLGALRIRCGNVDLFQLKCLG